MHVSDLAHILVSWHSDPILGTQIRFLPALLFAMTSGWQPLGQSVAETADFDTPHDEERLGCEVPYRQFPRLRRIALGLLLIDLVLVALLLNTLDPLITLLRRNEELFGARLALSRTDNPKDWDHQDKPKIPRILHQTCANETIPDRWVDSQQSCQKAYSDFEYKVCLGSGIIPYAIACL